jgi:hypothetical protein
MKNHLKKPYNQFNFSLSAIALFIFLQSNIACKNITTEHVSQNNSTSKLDSLRHDENDPVDSQLLKKYSPGDLKTNLNKHIINLDLIYDGGPGKNGIPAIDYPEFVSVSDAKAFLIDKDFGILLKMGNETRYYPYDVLDWHEVVNDNVNGVPVAVTFCPLCGSGIVYSRLADGDTLSFGVSGKLYESNLLMFDDKNESLWSQMMGEAVAGDYTGKKLQLINSDVTSFDDIVKYFPNAKVLSIHTGYDRNYDENPYADYMKSKELFFPVTQRDTTFDEKDIVYVVPVGNSAVAFNWKKLLEQGSAQVETRLGTVNVSIENTLPMATLASNNQPLPGYFSFWFAYYAFYGKDGYRWEID